MRNIIERAVWTFAQALVGELAVTHTLDDNTLLIALVAAAGSILKNGSQEIYRQKRS